ncbi:MAG: hypothetical protein QOK43_3261 [Acidimicrobiaceae bacterium]|nr:hypothetical protein [Acidimicrobiaceae bacterium]
MLKTGDEEAVSIRAVADAVGVTPPSIYLHFADKEELLVAVCEEQFRRFGDFVEQAVSASNDPVERLMLRGQAYVRFGIEHPEHYRILFMSRTGTARAADERARSVSGFDRLVQNVQACIDVGAIDAGALGEPDARLTATGLWVMVHGVTSLVISVPGFPDVGMDRLMAHLGAMCIRGLGG